MSAARSTPPARCWRARRPSGAASSSWRWWLALGRARAPMCRCLAMIFFQRQGEVRFARTLELPANRGKILDRNGLILASSVPAASIWAIPEDVGTKSRGQGQAAPAGQADGNAFADLMAKLSDEDKTFVWIKRQLDWDVGSRLRHLDIKGIYQRKEYKRQYPG